MKKKILDTFKAHGFLMEEMEGLGYGFEYEGRHFLYMNSEDDDDFLDIALPGVLDLEDKNDISFYQLMDKVNSTLKYVKANVYGDSMWLTYERELVGNEDLKQVIARIIHRLEDGYYFLHQAMKASDDYGETESNDSEATDDTDNEDVA